MTGLLRYRAGRLARERIAERPTREGISRAIRTYVCPATGPKWLVAYGVDRALVSGAVLRPGPDAPLITGASAGAWRTLALASPDPEQALADLADRYIGVGFGPDDGPENVSGAYREMLRELFSARVSEGALAGPRFPIAIETARVRVRRALFPFGLASAALLNVVSGSAQRAALARVTFASPGAEPILGGLHGPIRLSTDNWLDASLASGTVPFYMQPVAEIAGAGPGPFIDGGMTDYHLARRYEHDGLTLLVSHQERILERWLDQYVPWRRERARLLSRVLQVFPSDAFIATLPHGRIPTRDDFRTFAKRPEERIAAWREVRDASRALGEQWLRDLDAGDLPKRLEPIEPSTPAKGVKPVKRER